jgi:hypothetical protein
VIVYDLNVLGTEITPDKTDAILFVHTDAVLSIAVAN